MRMSSTWLLLALAAFAAAAPSKHNIRVKETTNVPRGWTKRDVAPRELTIDLRIALPQSNFPVLEQHLWEIRSISVLAIR